MKHKIKSFMYFIGLSKKDYEIIKPNIATYNRVMLGLFLYLASILMCSLLILSYILPTIFPNNIIYLGTLIFSLLILIISNKIDKTSYKATQILIYITISLFLSYSILTDTIFHPNQVSVTFIVMLVFLPILFIDRPIRCLGFSIGFTILFKSCNVFKLSFQGDVSSPCVYISNILLSNTTFSCFDSCPVVVIRY